MKLTRMGLGIRIGRLVVNLYPASELWPWIGAGVSFAGARWLRIFPILIAWHPRKPEFRGAPRE